MSGILRPTVAEIDLTAIRANVEAVVRKVAPAEVLAAIKGNAYGHGDLEVAAAALQAGATHLGVATLEEALRLKQNKLTAPIVVLGGVIPKQASVFVDQNLEPVVFTMAQARALDEHIKQADRRLKIHIKADTGMGRLGIHWQEAADFVKSVSELRGLEIKGLCTHFACSDWADKAYTYSQLKRFSALIKEVADSGIEIPIKHAANSGAILDMPESYFDMVRLGVAMYGYYPSSETSESIKLKPSMTLKSAVTAVKKILAGENVSYNRRYQAQVDTQIAVVPIGYADGYNRKLSNKAHVLIRGKRYPVVGTVCMDLIMVDVGLSSDITCGDEVVLLGKQGNKEVSIYEICEHLETIPYEVTSWVSERVPRVYVN